MKVEPADNQQPNTHEQSPNQGRGDQEIADRASEPGKDRIGGEEKHLTVVQTAVYERVDCVDKRSYGPGYETVAWHRAVGAECGDQQRAENQQLPNDLGRHDVGRDSQERQQRCEVRQRVRKAKVPWSGPVSAEEEARRQPGSGDDHGQARRPDGALECGQLRRQLKRARSPGPSSALLRVCWSSYWYQPTTSTI